MSTRNLEFLTPSRWLATTRGSRHLIAPTATNAPLSSRSFSPFLRPFPYRALTGMASFFSSTFFSPCFLRPLLLHLTRARTRALFGFDPRRTPKYHVVLQAAVRSDRSTRSRISTPTTVGRLSDPWNGTYRVGSSEDPPRANGTEPLRDRTTFAPSGQNRRSERRPVIRPRSTSTSDLTRTHRAITFNLCSS